MIGTYEERTFNMGQIMVSDSYIQPQTPKQLKTNDKKYNYIDSAIEEACLCLISSIKKRHSISNSRFFYNENAIDKLRIELKKFNPKIGLEKFDSTLENSDPEFSKMVGYRVVIDEDGFKYYEVNFMDVLKRTVSKI